MWLRRAAIVSGLALAVAACGEGGGAAGSDPSGTEPANPDSWPTFTVEGAFSFRGPADLTAKTVQPIDSQVGLWQGEHIEVHYDLGWYSDPLTGDPWAGGRREALTLEGRPAERVLLAPPAAGEARALLGGLHVPDLGDGETKLTVVVWGRDAAAARDAERLLRSLRLAPRS